MPGKFTFGDMIRHIAAIDRYMLLETVAGRKSAYKGCGKELADSYENVIKYSNNKRDESLEIFSSLSAEDLSHKCKTFGEAEIVLSKWLRIMVEYEIHHREQLLIYLNLPNVKTLPIFGLTSEEKKQLSVKLQE